MMNLDIYGQYACNMPVESVEYSLNIYIIAGGAAY